MIVGETVRNKFVYIFLFMLIFSFNSVKVEARTLEYKADNKILQSDSMVSKVSNGNVARTAKGGSGDILYTCKYTNVNFPTYQKDNLNPFVSKKPVSNFVIENFDVVVKKDGSLVFGINGNEVPTSKIGSGKLIERDDVGLNVPISIHCDNKDNCNNYFGYDGNPNNLKIPTCPNIYATEIYDNVYGSINFFDDNTNISVASRIEHIFDETSKNDEIDWTGSIYSDEEIKNLLNGIEDDKDEKKCSYTFTKRGALDIDQYMQIDFVVTESGKKKIVIAYNGGTKIEEFNNADLDISFPKLGTFHFYGPNNSTIPGGNDLYFPSGECNSLAILKAGGKYNIVSEDYAKNNQFGLDYEVLEIGSMDDILGDDGFLDNPVNENVGKCVDYLGRASESNSLAYLLDGVYNLIKIFSIVLVLLMSMLDFAKTITDNRDELMHSIKKFTTRIIVLIVILLLPSVIDMIGNLLGIEDILCGIK